MNNILLINSIFGFVLTTLLFFKKSTNTIATFFLGCFYLIFSIYTLQTYIVNAGHLSEFSWFFLWPLLLYNLISVPIYFYFVSIIEDQFHWKNRYLILFIPFLLGVIDVLAIYSSPKEVYTNLVQIAITDPGNRFSSNYWLLNLNQHYLLRHLMQAMALLVLLPKLRHFIRLGSTDKSKRALNKWLLFFWLILAFMSVMAILQGIEFWIDRSIFDYFFGFHNSSLIVTITLYLIVFIIGVVPNYFPMILHGYPQSKNVSIPNSADTPSRSSKNTTDSASHSKFGLEEAALEVKLENLNKKKLYLQDDFNITRFAREMEMPAHHLSYFLNQYYGLSFTTYKNKLRIDYATTLIQNGFLKQSTVDALALECGFANRSSFSKIFKNTVGLNPSEYLQNTEQDS